MLKTCKYHLKCHFEFQNTHYFGICNVRIGVVDLLKYLHVSEEVVRTNDVFSVPFDQIKLIENLMSLQAKTIVSEVQHCRHLLLAIKEMFSKYSTVCSLHV